jgi:Periplasmic binding protein
VRPRITIAAALAAVALLAAGCGRGGSSTAQGSSAQSPAQVSTSGGSFGTLRNVCGPGKPASSPAQGVTASQIQVGVFTDQGFSQDPSYANAANVFTSWCNAAGGINGRKIVFTMRDAALLNVVPQMISSCRQDFAIVGGAAALDGLAVKQRLQCLLPAIPAQIVMPQNIGSSLQVYPGPGSSGYYPYAGYSKWLMQTYPGSAAHFGIIVGDSPVTKILRTQYQSAIQSLGGTVTYSDLYPPIGVSDWTPYAQAIKDKGVKGLIFLGQDTQLVKLEAVLTSMNYKLDWIDANSNSYLPGYIQLLGRSASFQNNVADLSGTYPLEKATSNLADRQLLALFARYDAQGSVTLPVVRAFSAWLLFAKAASACGDSLTRKCLYDAALAQTAWTAGGLQAPADLSSATAPVKCFNVEQATAQGWQPARGFKPTTDGAYDCSAPAYKYTGSNYVPPITLAAVGKNMSQFK